MDSPTINDKIRAKAKDFVENEQQFQLGFLPTECSLPGIRIAQSGCA